MKQFLMTGAAILVAMAAVPASAQVTGSLSTANGNFLTLTNAGLRNGTTPIATLTGGRVYTSDRPFADIPKGGVFGNTFLAAGPSSFGSATLTFINPVNYFGFLWGSPDTFNSLTINSITGSTTGSQVFKAMDLGFPSVTGDQAVSQYVKFNAAAGTSITSVKFDNIPSTNAFEGANFSVAAVPEPATWGMMILGFGAIGFGMRRRKAKITSAVTYA